MTRAEVREHPGSFVTPPRRYIRKARHLTVEHKAGVRQVSPPTPPDPTRTAFARDVVTRATLAMVDPPEAGFTPGQVAYIVALALDVADFLEEDTWQAGFRAGYEQCNNELLVAVKAAVWGDDAPDLTLARKWHEKAISQRRRREAWDATAATPREGDHRGGPVEWDEAAARAERPQRRLRVVA